MVHSMKRVAITGGAGNIAYSLLFRIANGDLFGKEQPVALHILEIPQAVGALTGVEMELADCAFPLLQEVVTGSDPYQVFKGVDHALLVGAKPRTKGMERKDLLLDNAKIFIEQGRALQEVADDNCLVFVVGNPCNTNCWIAMNQAPRIPRTNFHAMTRLDQNRAVAQLAAKADVPVSRITRMTIWGNHSATQVPDFVNAQIDGKPVQETINDRAWLEQEFIETVQKRGAAVINARGKSSAASAASAAIDGMAAVALPNSNETWFSSGVCSDGNGYGVAEDLVFSFPCTAKDQIVENVPWDAFIQERIAVTEKELIEERDAVRTLL